MQHRLAGTSVVGVGGNLAKASVFQLWLFLYFISPAFGCLSLGGLGGGNGGGGGGCCPLPPCPASMPSCADSFGSMSGLADAIFPPSSSQYVAPGASSQQCCAGGGNQPVDEHVDGPPPSADYQRPFSIGSPLPSLNLPGGNAGGYRGPNIVIPIGDRYGGTPAPTLLPYSPTLGGYQGRPGGGNQRPTSFLPPAPPLSYTPKPILIPYDQNVVDESVEKPEQPIQPEGEQVGKSTTDDDDEATTAAYEETDPASTNPHEASIGPINNGGGYESAGGTPSPRKNENNVYEIRTTAADPDAYEAAVEEYVDEHFGGTHEPLPPLAKQKFTVLPLPPPSTPPRAPTPPKAPAAYPDSGSGNTPGPPAAYPDSGYGNTPAPPAAYPDSGYGNTPSPPAAYPDSGSGNTPAPPAAYPDSGSTKMTAPPAAYPDSGSRNTKPPASIPPETYPGLGPGSTNLPQYLPRGPTAASIPPAMMPAPQPPAPPPTPDYSAAAPAPPVLSRPGKPRPNVGPAPPAVDLDLGQNYAGPQTYAKKKFVDKPPQAKKKLADKKNHGKGMTMHTTTASPSTPISAKIVSSETGRPTVIVSGPAPRAKPLPTAVTPTYNFGTTSRWPKHEIEVVAADVPYSQLRLSPTEFSLDAETPEPTEQTWPEDERTPPTTRTPVSMQQQYQEQNNRYWPANKYDRRPIEQETHTTRIPVSDPQRRKKLLIKTLEQQSPFRHLNRLFRMSKL